MLKGLKKVISLMLICSLIVSSLLISSSTTFAATNAVEKMESYNMPGHFWRHMDFVGKLDNSSGNIYDTMFVERAGLADSTYVSFESVSYPGYYLRHSNYIIYLQKNDGTTAFKQDASFKKVAGLKAAAASSFQSYNFPTLYIRHANFGLRIDPIATDLDKSDATFYVRNQGVTINNPRYTGVGRPDPNVYKHTDGFYYGTHTNQNASGYVPNILLYKSANLSDLFNTAYKVVWTAPSFGWNSNTIWAPEITLINGVWYIYYTGGGNRTGVLKNTSADPTTGVWVDAGRLYVAGADDWAIDGTTFFQNGKQYFMWSGITPDMPDVQKIFISQMSSPTSLIGPRVELSRPTYTWEKQGTGSVFNVNEAPEVLQRNGKTFVTYSASFCETLYYALGMLTCASNADPMVPGNWSKSATPVFQASDISGLWGVGHNGFVKSKNGTQDWIIYHAKTTTANYTDRYVCMQQFAWNADGTPSFGAPVGRYIGIPKPSGE